MNTPEAVQIGMDKDAELLRGVRIRTSDSGNLHAAAKIEDAQRYLELGVLDAATVALVTRHSVDNHSMQEGAN